MHVRAGPLSSRKEVSVLKNLQYGASLTVTTWWSSGFLQIGAFPTTGMVAGGQPELGKEQVEVTGLQGVHHHRRLSPATTEVLSVWTAGLLEAPWLHQAQNMGLWELCLLERERNYPQLFLRNPHTVTLFPHSISISGRNRSPCRVWQIRQVSEEDSF